MTATEKEQAAMALFISEIRIIESLDHTLVVPCRKKGIREYGRRPGRGGERKLGTSVSHRIINVRPAGIYE